MHTANIGFVVGIELGEGGKVIEPGQQGGGEIHPLKVQRHEILPGKGPRKRILGRFDIIAVFPLAGVEAGMRLCSDRRYAHHGNISGQDEIQLVNHAARVGERREAVEMRHVIGGIHTRVRTSSPRYANGFPQQRGKRLFERLLHRRLVGLPLPSAVGCAMIAHFHKISHKLLLMGQR